MLANLSLGKDRHGRSGPPRATTDAFVAGAMERPEGARHGLVAGEVVAVAPERVGRGRAKAAVVGALGAAAAEAGLPVEDDWVEIREVAATAHLIVMRPMVTRVT
jgi:hypothetical protein